MLLLRLAYFSNSCKLNCQLLGEKYIDKYHKDKWWINVCIIQIDWSCLWIINNC